MAGRKCEAGKPSETFHQTKQFVGITKSQKPGSLPRNGLKLQLVVFIVSHWQEESLKALLWSVLFGERSCTQL